LPGDVITQPVIGLIDDRDRELPSMFRSVPQDGEERPRKKERGWRRFAAVIGAIALVVTAISMWYEIRSRSLKLGAQAPNSATRSMEEVILAATEQLSDMTNNNSMSVHTKSQGKQSKNEVLLSRLKAWMEAQESRHRW
jgi:hypothetical protein